MGLFPTFLSCLSQLLKRCESNSNPHAKPAQMIKMMRLPRLQSRLVPSLDQVSAATRISATTPHFTTKKRTPLTQSFTTCIIVTLKEISVGAPIFCAT